MLNSKKYLQIVDYKENIVLVSCQASLLSGDDAIFDQLLAIRRSISQLKHQYFEDLYEDAELQLLSANDTLSLRRHDSVLKAGSRGVYSRFTPSENNSEDSGISLESSGISSPSMSPSPVGAATAVVPVPSTDGGSVGDHPTAVHRNSVTFPPSRIRQNRYSNGGQRPGLNLSEVGPNGCRSVESHVDLLGEMRTSRDVQKAAMTTKGSRRSLCGPSATPPPPPALLVRSRSVTFLPRGVLVRREDSGVSGRADAPSNGEVFV